MPVIHTNGFGGSLGAELATVSPVYTSGDVWFVRSTTGTDAAAPAGKSREAPLATLGQAQTNAAAGDVIVMLSGHTETLATKLTLSKAGLVLLGEGQGTSQPSFKRSADVNLWDITGAGIRVENIRFLTDSTAAFAADRVLVSANTVLFRGCYFASSALDTISPALAIASGVTNLTIDESTYFISSGTSSALTGFSGLAFKGTATDVEMRDVVFDGGSFGWLSSALSAVGAITRLRVKDLSLLNGSDALLITATSGYVHVASNSGDARLTWP